jgi:4-alpha-methyl-delta7-sterol-4alpha-methyl oxidase
VNPLAFLDDPRFIQIVLISTGVSMGSFLLFATPLTLLAWRDPAWARRFRIQSRAPREQQLVLASIGRWVTNNALMTLLTALTWPLLRASSLRIDNPSAWWVVALEVLFFIYLDDFLFYWMHRTLHRPWLFKRIHAIHHKILTPWAITGHYMHPVEFILTGSLVLVGPMLLGVHVYTLWIWIAFRQWEAAEGHCGYNVPFSLTHFLPGGDGAFHHDFHHAKVKGNYAGFFTHCDRLFRTYARGYSDDHDRRHGKGPATS